MPREVCHEETPGTRMMECESGQPRMRFLRGPGRVAPHSRGWLQSTQTAFTCLPSSRSFSLALDAIRGEPHRPGPANFLHAGKPTAPALGAGAASTTQDVVRFMSLGTKYS